MPATATAQPSFVDHATVDRATVNRANAEHSTGPRSEAGKQRSSLNALSHGLTARTAVLPSEDPAAFELHCRQFADEYQPATPTEIQFVRQLADTSWRINRIPLLEANLLAGATRLACHANPQPTIQTLSVLGLHGQRLSRQFQKTLDQLRAIQSDRRQRELVDLKAAAALPELHKQKGIPWVPAQHGFVFSKEQVERAAERILCLKESRLVENVHPGSFSKPMHAPLQAPLHAH